MSAEVFYSSQLTQCLAHNKFLREKLRLKLQLQKLIVPTWALARVPKLQIVVAQPGLPFETHLQLLQ